jgi:fused signal recognition particle receptor
MFGFIREKLKKIYASVTCHFSSLFLRKSIDKEFLQELSRLLISSDAGVSTTSLIIEKLSCDISLQKIITIDQLKKTLEDILVNIIKNKNYINYTPRVLLMVGVNGSGKTTFCAKYANLLTQSGKKVLLVAGDTFRAAATKQLVEWGEKISVPVFVGKENQDPASVVFDACNLFKEKSYDHIIIDTAGRLQTKVNLLKELEKIGRIINRQLPYESCYSWLTVDAMIGQNSLQQAEIFHTVTKLNGIILTKLDGTGKGGIVFSIVTKLSLPIIYITYGETLNDIKQFDACDYVRSLLYE